MNNFVSVEYEKNLQEAYLLYELLVPMDLQDADSRLITYWQRNNKFSIREYARIISLLNTPITVDAFIKSSQSDFDNLAPVLESAISAKLVLSQQGVLRCTLKRHENVNEYRQELFTPKSEYNQFPCDDSSVYKRYMYVLEAYPFMTSLKLGIIGDDDLLSRYTTQDSRFETVVIEKDPRVIDIVKKLPSKKQKLEIYSIDIPNDSYSNLPKVSTFITDPPYTYHGSLAFIVCGLSILDICSDNEKEFYVVLNKTMMGKNLDMLISVLASNGVLLHHVVNDFSQYKLPDNFIEKTRADTFSINCLNIKSGPIYSSSSNLYVFKTTHPDINVLKTLINPSSLYEHYEKI